MQAINHTVFGTLVAVIIKDPFIAAPVALASHFVMDTIPHYGDDPKAPRGSTFYNLRIAADTIASLLVLVWFLSFHPAHPGLILLCVLLAILPDLLWPLALFIKQKGPLWAFFKFHKSIQTENRSGVFVELAWLIASASLVVYKIR